MSEHEEDKPFVTKLGPVSIDWPRTAGFYGGLAVAVATELVAPPLAAFIAIVPLLKLLKRDHATLPERFVAALLEGAAKPVGGDAEATVRPASQVEEEQLQKRKARHRRQQVPPRLGWRERFATAAQATWGPRRG